MSWADDYFKLVEEERKKKKKEELTPAETFETSPYSAMGRLAAKASPKSPLNKAAEWKETKKDLPEPKKDEEEGLGDRLLDAAANMFPAVKVGKGIYDFAQSVRNVELDFFQKGPFEDGFEWPDIPKAILGTAGDVAMEAAAGFGGALEGINDLILHGSAKIAEHNGYTNDAQRLREQAEVDVIGDVMLGEARDAMDNWSVLGRTSKSAAQGLGPIALILATGGAGSAAGLGSTGVSLLTTGTTFASSAGAGINEAYLGGATDDEAWKYGLSVGAIDAGTELLFGGLGKTVNALGLSKGISSLDDIFAKKLSSQIANQTAKNMVEFGVKASAEGFEEVLAGIGTAISKKLTYMSEEELSQLVKDENLLEQFVVGSVISVLAQGGDVIDANRTGRDFVTDLTSNEQKVLDKVFKDRIAEAEKDGKVSKRDQSKIYDEVLKDLGKGYISTDIIEEVLGGEDYKSYKDSMDSEKALKDELEALQTEYDGLGDLKESELTVKQRKRLNELEQQMQDIQARIDDPNSKGQRDYLKAQLSKNVYEMTKNDRLVESYFENVRRNQKFEADLSKYEGKAKEVIKQVMDSGLADNSRATHEFWDMAAKIAENRDTKVSIADNAQIIEMLKKEHEAKGKTFDASQFEGKTIDGFISENGIVLNAESKRARSFVIGHEITHSLEKSKHYDQLQKLLYNYNQAEYKSRFDSRKAQYKGIYSDAEYKAKIDKEVTADMVGDFVFSDYDFVKHLATQNQNVFQKIWNEIKYLAKIATAGSKEARELEKVKREFERAWNETKAQKTGKTKFSVSDSYLNDLTIDDIINMSDEEVMQAWKDMGLDELELTDDILLDDDFSIESISKDMDVEPEVVKVLFRRNGLGSSHVEDNHKAVMTQDRIDKRIAEHGAKRADYARRYITRISPKDFIDMTVYEENMDRDKFDSRVRGDLDSKMGDWDYEKQLRDSEEPPVLIIDKSTGQIIGHNGRHRMRALEMAGIESVEIEVELHDEDGSLIKYNSQTIQDMAISSQYDTAIETHLSNIIPLNNAHRGDIGAHYGESAHANAGVKYSLSDSDGKKLRDGEIPLEQRLSGDALLDAEDLIAEIEGVAEISPNGYVTVYHRTTEENAKRIMESGKMSAKEDGIFFSTQKDGIYSVDYGKGVVELKVPAEKFVLDDIFDTEAHLRIPMKTRNDVLDVSAYLPTSDMDIQYSISDTQNEQGLDRKSEISYSLSNDTAYMDKAIEKNNSMRHVDSKRMEEAKGIRNRISGRMNEIKDRGLVGLPEDIEGNTYIANSSYDGTEENTTICPRSLASEAFVDAVSEYLGRPLTVEEQIYISQDLQGRSLTPECTYCYVATDRKAYRAFLGEYINQRDAVLQKVQADPNADVSRSGELYKEFLNGRKDTEPMYKRFKMWVDAYKNGTPMVDASHLANINKLMGDINSEFGEALKPQITDAMKYAQSASWAKKRINYVAYNGHILNWKQDRINKLNSHYGLRMYSFSDFHPAFVLENMQMITDASVRGLKMLGYTKDTDFVEIFAPSGMNINVSTFGFEAGGNVYENNIIGAEWEKAKALREQYPNVGVTFVATNDTLVDWALEQDWIDVVIPYHLVHTGTEVAKAFGYTNYTSESADTKTKEWAKGDKKSIAPTEHNNDLETYFKALEKNHLNPRFERFKNRPNYMKLVNECRQSASDSKPVQPVFNEDAAMKALAKLEANGYYQPIGGSVERMYEIAAEVAENMNQELAPAMSISDAGQTFKTGKGWNAPMSDMRYIPEDIAPVSEEVNTKVNTEVKNASVEDLFPDNYAPTEAEEEAWQAERMDSLMSEDAPPEVEAPYYGESEPASAEDPFDDRDWYDVGKRNVKAYMYENPEVKPFFQTEAMNLLTELKDTTKAERWYNDELYYESGGEAGFGGVKRHTSDSIAELLDSWHMSYADIEKGLNAIIEDNGAENIAAAKKLEFMLNDRLLHGYKDFYSNGRVPPSQDYINLLNEKQITEYSTEAFDALMAEADRIAPVMETVDTNSQKGVVQGQQTYITTEDKLNNRHKPMGTAEVDPGEYAPVAEKYEAIKPKRTPSKEPRMARADSKGEERRWYKTSTGSDAVDGKVTPDDIPDELRYYQPIPNKKTLGNANSYLAQKGYDKALAHFNEQIESKKVSLDDIALGERLIQEAIKNGDTKTASELIQNVAILGTELGQKVQALSIIKKLTPEGQLMMLQKTVDRGKTKGDKAFEGVELTQEMKDKILSAYKPDGSFDQMYLTRMVEDVKQQIADQMKVTAWDKINAWRYLSMLGNPKTHIRNLVSNVAMYGTRQVKNAIARTIEDIAPIEGRTKTWKQATDAVKAFSERMLKEMDSDISGDKYSDSGSIKAKRKIFDTKAIEWASTKNSELLQMEDEKFSKPAFKSALSEFLTANGIKTETDIKKNPELVAKAKQYAMEQAKEATFQQDSYLANKIGEIERKNPGYGMLIGSVLPFKKTPINIAKAGLNYSPLGIARNIYDMVQVKKGNMDASEAIDHVAQTLTGSSLTLVGFMLAQAGILNGAGDDDKEGEYDYQLGKQAYSLNFFGDTFSLSWLSPVAMPLFVGANAYEQLVEGKEWNADVVVETLAQTLDPLSEMSFLSSLDSVLSSYDSGIQKFMGIFETAGQNYITQFVPTLSSQVAAAFDKTKRSTKVAADSDFKFGDRLLNQIKYKIPGLRNTLEPSTDIWGNENTQTEIGPIRALESFFAPWSKRENITSAVDEEIKDLYSQVGDGSVIPSIPSNTINYDGVKYEMSAKEHTAFKQAYGQLAYDTLEDLFNTDTYRNADAETRRDMVKMVYDYARDEARRMFFDGRDVDFTNATEDGDEVYKENAIVGAIKADLPVAEYKFSEEYPEKYKFFKDNGLYENYAAADEEGKRAYSWAYENPGKYTMSKAVADDFLTFYRYRGELFDLEGEKDENGKTISGSKKEKVIAYINDMDLDYGQKIILFRSMYSSKEDRNNYNADILEYLNSREDLSFEERVTILKELGFNVNGDKVTWD